MISFISRRFAGNRIYWAFSTVPGCEGNSADTRECGPAPSTHRSGRHWNGIERLPFSGPPVRQYRAANRGLARLPFRGRKTPQRYRPLRTEIHGGELLFI